MTDGLARAVLSDASGNGRAISVRDFLYLAVTLVTLTLNTAVFWSLHVQFEWSYLLAQLLATGVVFLINFQINRLYTFKSFEEGRVQ